MLLRSALSDSAAASNVPPVALEPVVEQVATIEVLASVRDLRVGETLSAGDLAWVSWPEESITDALITQDTQPDAMTEIPGQIVRIPIFAEEPIRTQKIVSRGDTGVMAALVSPGMRAVSLEISVESASGGFILPEDRVDVILTHEVLIETGEGTEDQIQSDIILENVRVLAIDQGVAASDGSNTYIGSTATLELSPADAALVTFGERKGFLSLALRSMTDAALAGDVVTAHSDRLNAKGAGRIRIYRNGRVQGASAASSGE